jgi:hypothetical protein
MERMYVLAITGRDFLITLAYELASFFPEFPPIRSSRGNAKEKL